MGYATLHIVYGKVMALFQTIIFLRAIFVQSHGTCVIYLKYQVGHQATQDA